MFINYLCPTKDDRECGYFHFIIVIALFIIISLCLVNLKEVPVTDNLKFGEHYCKFRKNGYLIKDTLTIYYCHQLLCLFKIEA